MPVAPPPEPGPRHRARYPVPESIHLPDRLDVKATVSRHEAQLDARLLQYKRKKRSGRFITREEQEKKIEQKERKLAEEIRQEREAAGEVPPVPTPQQRHAPGEERDAKRIRLLPPSPSTQHANASQSNPR